MLLGSFVLVFELDAARPENSFLALAAQHRGPTSGSWLTTLDG